METPEYFYPFPGYSYTASLEGRVATVVLRNHNPDPDEFVTKTWTVAGKTSVDGLLKHMGNLSDEQVKDFLTDKEKKRKEKKKK